jgi:DNA-binding CsgD family transcriptional regulator
VLTVVIEKSLRLRRTLSLRDGSLHLESRLENCSGAPLQCGWGATWQLLLPEETQPTTGGVHCNTAAGEQVISWEKLSAAPDGSMKLSGERMAQQAANEAKDLLTQLQPGQVQAHPLSPREMEVLRLVAEGLTNKEIAYRLGLSERTVQFHLNAVFTKTDANSRTEATATAFKLGWL